MRRVSEILLEPGVVSYQKLMAAHNPFEYLTHLKDGSNYQISQEEDFDPDSINKKLHTAGGALDMDALAGEINIRDMIMGVITDNSMMPRDLKVDDGDFPLAKNVYEWVTSNNFAGTVITPYVEQMIWCTQLFSEWCPRCSDSDYFETRNTSDSLSTFSSKIAMLEHGVCPHCKARKSELVLGGELHFYQEFAAQVGQRCVVGDTMIMTEHGHMRIDEYASSRPVGFSPMCLRVHNGSELETTSQYFVATPEPIYEARLSNGLKVGGTKDHPVQVLDKTFTVLGQLKTGTLLAVRINQQHFGSTVFRTPSAPAMGIPLHVRTGSKEHVCSYLANYIRDNSTMLSDGLVISAPFHIQTQLSTLLNNIGVYNEVELSQLKVQGVFLDRLVQSLDLDPAPYTYTYCEYDKEYTALGQEVKLLLGIVEQDDWAKGLLKELESRLLTRQDVLDVYERYEFEDLALYADPDTVIVQVVSCVQTGNVRPTYDFTLPRTHQFVTNSVISHNSGKTAIAGGVMSPYMTHRILKMQKPCDVYGIASATVLHGTFCALTYAQAKETLWDFYYGTLVGSKFFSGYHDMLRFYENKYGQNLLKFNDTFVKYSPRNLLWYPAGPDKRVLRGRTRVMGGVDEIGYFDNDAASNKVKTSAHHVYDAIDASLLTVRGAAERLLKAGHDNILTAFNINVSSPASQRDKICSLVRQSRTSKKMLGIHRPTWEVNPDFPRDSETIVEAYQRAAGDAERNFGANPPLVANPYLPNTKYIKESLVGKKNGIKTRDVIKRRKNVLESNKWATVVKVRKLKYPTIMTMDAGVVNNSFALTVLYQDPETGLIMCPTIAEVIPDPGVPLNYTEIYNNLISPMIVACNVKVLLADRWNSLKILTDAEADHSVYATQYSLKYLDIGITKSHLEAGTIMLPERETDSSFDDLVQECTEGYPYVFKGRPIDHLAVQMMTVQDSGKGVLKGDGLTDDTFRALALGTYALSNEKYTEHLVGEAEDLTNPATGPMGVIRLGSGASGTGGGALVEGIGVVKKGR